MNVFVLNPPFLKHFSRPQRSPAVTKSGTVYFPIWQAWAVGLLERQGFHVDFVDAPADGCSYEDCLLRARKLDPALIVIDTSTPSIYNDVQIAAKFKTEFPNAFVILVGTHVSALPEEALRIDETIDAVARREYDHTLVELAQAIEAGADLSTVAGLTYRKDGQIINTPDRPFIENLDELPFVSEVYKKYLNIENYFNPNALYPMVTIMSSRGCPFRCTFCVYPQTMMGRGFRLRSVENVVDEMEYIVQNFPHAKAIFFEDDTMTVNKKRCMEFCQEILRRGLKISWNTNSRVDLDYETMKMMKKAGCRNLCVGFESGDQAVLDEMRKNIKVEQMYRFMKDARKARMLIHGCFLVGLPGETKETMQKTLTLAKKLSPDTAQFYPVMVYPGTEAYDWYKQKDLLVTHDFRQWITNEGLHNTVVSTHDVSALELVRFCDDARKQFYLNPKYLIYKSLQMFVHPREIRRTLKAARTFLKYLIKGSDVTKEPECKSC